MVGVNHPFIAPQGLPYFTQVLAYRALLDGPQSHALLLRFGRLTGAWLSHVTALQPVCISIYIDIDIDIDI